MMKHILLVTIMLGFSQYGFARTQACNELGGGVIFKDTLYGAATGAVLTGLAIAASDSDAEVGRSVAAGALVGAGVGVIYGVYEAVSRPCVSRVVMKKGWNTPKLYSGMNSKKKRGYGLSVTYVLN